jgi:hypothetical protein
MILIQKGGRFFFLYILKKKKKKKEKKADRKCFRVVGWKQAVHLSKNFASKPITQRQSQLIWLLLKLKKESVVKDFKSFFFFEKNSFSFHRIQEQKLLQLQNKP